MSPGTSSPLPQAGGAGGGPDRTTSRTFKPRDTARARTLRAQASPAERTLWRALSGRKLRGWKFSRQMPVGPYFADFLCRAGDVVVELDGHSHDQNQAYDRARDRYMTDAGLTVLRFANEEVLGNLDGVTRAIADALDKKGPPPTPPASGRGEGRTSRLPSRMREGLGVGPSTSTPTPSQPKE